MDKKEQQLFAHYYNKFVERSFDEKDFYSFMMLVRDDAHGIDSVNGLADFIALREKSSGYVGEYLGDCKQVIANLGNGVKAKKIEDIFSFKEIRNGFNALFLKNGFEKLPAEIINDFILCTISLLQDVKLVSGNLNKEVGHLSFAVSSKEVFLMGNMKTLNKGRYIPVTFQVLSVKNSYEAITPQDKNDTPYLFNEELIEVVNIEGNLVITFPE
ncbi:hypothetical protein MKY15_04390 [Sporosarcina sp. FSL K6-1540]|uniref:Uncharacterized protein n=1 Tax=Sporosarcina psychrophila TaxID=1476 RepID=A0ABV2K2Y3_SPOPS|nr:MULTISPECIES: hypothetical protein [Sporosarcina]AMQ07749.1 hypothetical protein AZE41_18380 [Sporosarcina psychrophila]QNK87558.1 hypothetical protein H7992_20640 [Sporosarcina sp. resist]